MCVYVCMAELTQASVSLRQSHICVCFSWQCETLVEELEDDIVSLLGREEENVKKKLCSKVSGRSSVLSSRQYSFFDRI